MPAYNAAAFIRQAIESALQQTYTNIEVVVVDDGSRDNTAIVVESIARQDSRVRLLRQHNRGVAEARNLAIAHSRGEFIAPLDADDLWMPHKIERQVECMMKGGSQVGLVYSWWLGIDEADTITSVGAQWNVEGNVLEVLTYCNFIGNASIPLFRRASLDHIGGYNADLRAQQAQGCEDWDMALRLAERYEVRCVPEYLSCYRDVVGSMAKNGDAMEKSHALVVRQLQARQPQIPQTIYRWSRSLILFWLTGLSYHDGNYRNALKFGWRLLRNDPAAILSPWVRNTLARSVAWLALKPLREHHKSRRNQAQSKEQNGTASRLSLADLDKIKRENQDRPFMWRRGPWPDYDRVCIGRWKRLSRKTKRARPPKRTSRRCSSKLQNSLVTRRENSMKPIHHVLSDR
jgi:glycosyltransferase involved in cell wall biosynthesis